MNSAGNRLPLQRKPLFWVASFCAAAVVILAALFVFHVLSLPTDVHSSPSALAGAYMDGFKNKDYDALAALKFTEQSMSKDDYKVNKEMLQSIKIKEIKCVDKYEGKNFACYQYSVNLSDEGISTLSRGQNPRWLFMVLKNGKWYAQGLMTGSPSQNESPGKYWRA